MQRELKLGDLVRFEMSSHQFKGLVLEVKGILATIIEEKSGFVLEIRIADLLGIAGETNYRRSYAGPLLAIIDHKKGVFIPYFNSLLPEDSSPKDNAEQP